MQAATAPSLHTPLADVPPAFAPTIAPQGERVLFHYNGHGVPRPTANGEVWVFNKSYTQYIPLSVYDLQVGGYLGLVGLGRCSWGAAVAGCLGKVG